MIKVLEQHFHNVQYHGELTEKHNPVTLGVKESYFKNISSNKPQTSPLSDTSQ